MNKDTYPIIGMSPGNSYFKDEEVRYLLQQVVQRYGRTAILIADTPAISTYLAFGYPQTKARNKAILKGNNLKNRTRRIMQDLGFSEGIVHIIDWEKEVETNESYKSMYKHVLDLYTSNAAFTRSVDQTTRAVLENSGHEYADDAVKTAIHYLLSELAFLEFAPAFLQSKNIAYVYHKNWPVYEDYIAGSFDGQPKLHLNFILLEHPSETYVSIEGNEPSTDTHGTSYERMMRTKSIRASYEDYSPAFMTDAKTTEHSGIFHDILKRFTEENDMTLRFTEETGYGVIVEGLNSMRFDIFASTVWPTPERVAAASFSDAVYFSEVHMWMREGAAVRPSDNSNFRIAIKENDISHSIALADFPAARLVYVPQLADPVAVLAFVAEGKADATFAEPYLASVFNNTSSVKVMPVSKEPLRRYPNTFMFRQGENELKNLLDTAIQRYKAEGFILRLIEKYTGSSATFPLQ